MLLEVGRGRGGGGRVARGASEERDRESISILHHI